ncbi:MAG TPA: OsmC family protein [Longimicrobiales bacterium]
MAGTFVAALEARGIAVDATRFVAEVSGTNEMNDAGIPVLRRIDVRYRVPVPEDKREAAERALAKHVEKCPTAQTLKGAVEVTASAEWV